MTPLNTQALRARNEDAKMRTGDFWCSTSEADSLLDITETAHRLYLWLNEPGLTNKSRRGRVPAGLLDALGDAIAKATR